MRRHFIAACIALLVASSARAGVVVYSGYHDDNSAQFAVPSPWLNDPNTVFLGNGSDLAAAASTDPDLAALRFVNTGALPVSLQAVSDSVENLFARASFPGPWILTPGQNLIVAVGDGSDMGLVHQVISFTIDGNAFSVPDATNSTRGAVPNGVLDGFPDFWESVPWTQIADVLEPNAAPEPATVTLLAFSLVGIAAYGWRRRKNAAA